MSEQEVDDKLCRFCRENAATMPRGAYIAKIFGNRRWSFLCGTQPDIPGPILRIHLAPGYGLCLPSGTRPDHATRLTQALQVLFVQIS